MPTSMSKTDIAVSKVEKVTFESNRFVFHLEDGRQLSTPLWWYPRLQSGTLKQRRAYRILPGATGVTWDALDEDISVQGLLMGEPAPGAIPPVLDAAE